MTSQDLRSQAKAKMQINRETHGANGVVVLWEQAVAPSKRAIWEVQVGSTRTPHTSFYAAYNHYQAAA